MLIKNKYSKQFNIYLFLCWIILHAFLLSNDFFFQNQLFQKLISGIPSECQTVWIQIRPDKLSGLIWVHFLLLSLSADNTSRQRVNQYYRKTCVKRPLSKRPKIGFRNQLLLNAGKMYLRD